MELDTGSAISAVTIEKFLRIYPNHEIFLPDVQLRTSTGETLKSSKLKVVVSCVDKTTNIKLYLKKKKNIYNFLLIFSRDCISEFNIFHDKMMSVRVNGIVTLLTVYKDC